MTKRRQLLPGFGMVFGVLFAPVCAIWRHIHGYAPPAGPGNP